MVHICQYYQQPKYSCWLISTWKKRRRKPLLWPSNGGSNRKCTQLLLIWRTTTLRNTMEHVDEVPWSTMPCSEAHTIYIYIRILTYLQHMTNITQATQRLLKHHAASYDLIPSASLSVPKARGSHGRSSRRHLPVVAAGPVASCGEKRDANGECLPADRNLGAALMERWIRRQKSGLSKLKLSWTILFFLNQKGAEMRWSEGSTMIFCTLAICWWLLEGFVMDPGAKFMDRHHEVLAGLLGFQISHSNHRLPKSIGVIWGQPISLDSIKSPSPWFPRSVLGTLSISLMNSYESLWLMKHTLW